MTHASIRFIRRGQPVVLNRVPAHRTLLQVLREDLACTGTKEGCNEGDCGACTVVVGELDLQTSGGIRYKAVNSCIKPAHAIDGLALWTVEDIADQNGRLHPAQEAIARCHGSQCGFCTPGFVMSLFGMYQNRVCQGQVISREVAQQDLSGNLCRCTGYRPLLEAASAMADLPEVPVDEPALVASLKALQASQEVRVEDASYLQPTTLPELLRLRAQHPGAQIVAGCTDVGLWINKLHMDFERLLDVTRVAELRQIGRDTQQLSLGAAVTLTDAFDALETDRPQLHTFASRFAGLPVRNAGTLGGNVANGSPIGDSMPLLIALGASVVLASERGERELPLEGLYTGYRKNVMAPDEVLARIQVPHPKANEQTRVYKISKRFDDDISAVCLAVCLVIERGQVMSASIGVGGVAATPVRARKTESVLTGQAWNEETLQKAISTLRTEFQPISDMRASSAYRTQVLGGLLQRYWLESQGMQDIRLESYAIEGDAA
ncbi:MAG: xanthine dehydrogenase small subunit [Pseudomonadota bacterium]